MKLMNPCIQARLQSCGLGNAIARVNNMTESDIVEVHCCVVTMKGKLVSFEHSSTSVGLRTFQSVDPSISSSAVIQN